MCDKRISGGLVLLVAVAFGLFGCGSTDTSTQKAADSSAVQTESQTSTSSAQQAGVSAMSADVAATDSTGGSESVEAVGEASGSVIDPGAIVDPGMMGPGAPNHGPFDHLGLSTEQQSQADAIFTQLRTDTENAFAAADEQVRGILTDEQKAKFTGLQPLAGIGGGPEGGCRGPGDGLLGMEPLGSGNDPLLDRLAKDLVLTDAQRTSVETVLNNLQTTIQSYRDKASADFRAILTAEQLAILDPLQLTEEQRTQANAISAQARVDVKKLNDNANEQIRNLLTDDQKTKLDAQESPGAPADGPHPFDGQGAAPPPAGGNGPHGGPGMRPSPSGPPPVGKDSSFFVDRLAGVLGLTAEQKASIETILKDLHSAVQARLDQAKTDFRAILTPEQISTLDALEARHGDTQ